MERRQFLYGVIATGAAAVGAAVLGSAPALGATAAPSATHLSSTESWLLGTGRRALG